MHWINNAIYRFDLSYNVKFSIYAVSLILGEIIKYFRDEVTIKVSRGIKELHMKIKEYCEEFIKEKHSKPRIKEIAKYLNVIAQDIIFALESHYY